MAEQLSQGQHSALGRRILGHVGRDLIDMNGIEKPPQRMRWIGQAPVGKCVSSKEIAEFVP